MRDLTAREQDVVERWYHGRGFKRDEKAIKLIERVQQNHEAIDFKSLSKAYHELKLPLESVLKQERQTMFAPGFDQQAAQAQADAKFEATKKLVFDWFAQPRPGTEAPLGYIATAPCINAVLVAVGDAEITHESLNEAASSGRIPPGIVFHPNPHPANFAAVAQEFIERKVPKSLRSSSGLGMNAGIATDLAKEIALHHGNHFTVDNLQTALITVFPAARKMIDDEFAEKMTAKDALERAERNRKNSAVQQGRENPDERTLGGFEAQKLIGEELSQMIRGGFRDFAKEQSELAQKSVKAGGTMQSALKTLRANVSAFLARQATAKIIAAPIGKTTGEISRNRTALALVAAEAEKQGMSAEDIARLVREEANHLQGVRGVEADHRLNRNEPITFKIAGQNAELTRG